MMLGIDRVGRGTDVVLVHGWGMNLGVWGPLVSAWRDRCRLTRIELPGHGGSACAESADAVTWVHACLDAAPDRALWVGWSLGGQLAVQAALAAPERVTGLGLIATTPCFVQRTDWPLGMPDATFSSFANALIQDPEPTLMRFLALQVKGDTEARKTMKQLRGAVNNRPMASSEGLRQGLELLRDTDLRDRLAGLRCRQVWLLGQRDTLVSGALRDWLWAALPQARVETIRGAGHAPFLSHPRECVMALDELINEAGKDDEGVHVRH